jgi:hypothetical protein
MFYSLEVAVFVSGLRERRWGMDVGRQDRIVSVVVRVWWVEVGCTVALNLMRSG